MRYSQVSLHSFGYELPPRVVSSSELETWLAPVYERLKLPAGRLELMSGIESRRFWDAGTKPSDGAALAGRKALAASGVEPEAIGALIFTSVSRDLLEPATASFVHQQLGLSPHCLIFDLSNACLGFLNGMIMVANMIELGQIRHGLLVAGETAEGLVESTVASLLNDPSLTRKSIKSSFASLTIGSGAVALVMSAASVCHTGHRLVGGVCRANTGHNHLCQGGGGGESTLMATDSEELLVRGVETAALAWRDFQKELPWPTASIARYFCHQVGRAHAKLLFEQLALPLEKNFETIGYLGNVGSVSAPITLAIGLEQGAVVAGERLAMLGIGSGINCLMLGIEW